MAFSVKAHTLEHPKTGLRAIVNQYLPSAQSKTSNQISIVFGHSTSNHKEQWDVIISRLFDLCPDYIYDAWSIELESHGSSAVINQSALSARCALSIEDYADLLRHFIQSDHVSSRKVVAVGHSASTAAWTLAAFQITLPTSPIIAFVFYEPVHVLPPIIPDDDRLRKGIQNLKGIYLRKTTFDSLEEAEKWCRKRFPWKIWDERVFQSYMKHGFSPVSPGSKQVAVNCTIEQEAWLYEAYAHLLAGHLYSQLCSSFPVHGIFGARPDMYSADTRKRYFDGMDGHHMASVDIIPKAGHLVVQEKPDECAIILARILNNIHKKNVVIKPSAHL